MLNELVEKVSAAYEMIAGTSGAVVVRPIVCPRVDRVGHRYEWDIVLNLVYGVYFMLFVPGKVNVIAAHRAMIAGVVGRLVKISQ